MKIKKLTTRTGVPFTPLVHRDSVVDKSGVPLKKFIAPIAVQGVKQDYSAYTDFRTIEGNHIGLKVERVDMGDNTFNNKLTITHDNTTTVETAKSKVYLLGTTGADGNNKVLTSSSYEGDNGVVHPGMTYSPDTDTLKVPKIDAEIVGGNIGSLVYQENTDVTTMLPIGTAGQILMVKEGIPAWVNKTAGVTGHQWNNGTSEGPVLELVRENMENLVLTPIPSASASTSGVVTTVNQIFSGDKTFANNVVVEGDLTVKGDVIAINEKHIEVSDKVITLATSVDASPVTGSGSGFEITTKYNPDAVQREDKYKGPNLLWTLANGWTFGNTDEQITDSKAYSLVLGHADSTIKMGDRFVIENDTTYTKRFKGVADYADKTTGTLTFSETHKFNGPDLTVNQNDIDGILNVEHGGTGLGTFVEDTIYLGNGTKPLKPLTNAARYQAICISATGVPAYETLTLDHVPEVAFSLYQDTTLSDVEDFTI